MEIEFDPDKDKSNHERHGLWLSDFQGFDSAPEARLDERTDYGETRYRAFGRIDRTGYCVVFTVRGTNLRLISFRRAHEKEMRRYGR